MRVGGLRRVSNPALLAITAEGFLSRLSFGIISFALPLYARRQGMSLGQIGLLVSTSLAVAMVLKPAAGWAADKVGLRTGLIAAMCLRSLVAGLLIFASLPWQLFAVRAVHGMSVALRDPSVDALIAEHGGKGAVASAYAWYQTAKSVAGSLGKALAGLLLALTASSFPIVFAIAFVLSALPLTVVVRAVPTIEGEPAGDSPGSGQSAVVRVPPRLAPYAGLAFLMAATADMLHGLLPLLAVEYAGLTESQTGMVFLVATVVSLVAGPVFGWLSDNVSHKLVLSLRALANAGSSLVLLGAPNLWGMMTGKMLDDAGKAAFRPAWGALMAQLSAHDRRNRARTMSVLSMGEDAGAIAGPILAGLLWAAGGVPALLLARVGLAVVAEIYSVRVIRKMPSEQPDGTYR
ncbi:MAG: MFS transporter [Acidimicrobiia bacterium]|nr:MFS transporter [Acidimicrobiia bacterium]